MTRTYLSVSEKTDDRMHRSNYILHDDWKWYHADTNSKEQMDDLLNFFECEILDVAEEHEFPSTGKITFYNLSKDIINHSDGGFWSIDQMNERAGARRIKSFIGLSNGSLVTCYAAFDDVKNTVEILRPNPNAKEVYRALPLSEHITYAKNHWVL